MDREVLACLNSRLVSRAHVSGGVCWKAVYILIVPPPRELYWGLDWHLKDNERPKIVLICYHKGRYTTLCTLWDNSRGILISPVFFIRLWTPAESVHRWQFTANLLAGGAKYFIIVPKFIANWFCLNSPQAAVYSSIPHCIHYAISLDSIRLTCERILLLQQLFMNEVK